MSIINDVIKLETELNKKDTYLTALNHEPNKTLCDLTKRATNVLLDIHDHIEKNEC